MLLFCSASVAGRAARSAQLVACTTRRAIAIKSTPICGMGGPQTIDERPAAVVREIPQIARTAGSQLRQRK